MHNKNNKQLKVLFLPTANAGVVWHRMMKFFTHLRINKEINPAMDAFDPDRSTPYEWQFEKGCTSLLLDQMQKLVEQADVVVMGYIITDYGVAILRALKHIFPNKPFLMDIDDYCFQLNKYSPAVSVYRPNGEAVSSVEVQLREVDGVVVTHDYLGDMYRRYNKNIHIIPNSIDFDLWDKLKVTTKKKSKKKIRIGWCGGATHSEDIMFIEDAIHRILKKHKHVEFSFAGGAPAQLINLKNPRIKCNNKWANPYKYPQRLKNEQFDIGLAPLLDNNFNRGKSNLRYLEYSALQIPTIASDTEHFKKSITDGLNGFLVTEPDEWFEAMDMLIQDKDRREEMGLRAYDFIKKEFNIIKTSKKYATILKDIYKESKKNEPRNNKKQNKITKS